MIDGYLQHRFTEQNCDQPKLGGGHPNLKMLGQDVISSSVQLWQEWGLFPYLQLLGFLSKVFALVGFLPT